MLRRHLPLLLGAIALLLAAAPGAAAAAPLSQPQDTLDLAGNIVSVLGPEAKGNPFAGQYGPWDAWLFDHLIALGESDGPPAAPLSFDAVLAELAAPGSDQGMLGLVTLQGYLMPRIVLLRRLEEARGKAALLPALPDGVLIRAAAPLDPELTETLFGATAREQAAHYPAVPKWLADNPPYAAALLPNGEIVTRGVLGDALKSATPQAAGAPLPKVYARYSKTGKRLAKVENRHWWYLYYGTKKPQPKGALTMSPNGYVEFCDVSGESVLSRWDYNGKQLKRAAPIKPRDCHGFIFLTPSELLRFYNAQHNVPME